eukprot:10353360-Heterocapsa_arctica.AAC.1
MPGCMVVSRSGCRKQSCPAPPAARLHISRVTQDQQQALGGGAAASSGAGRVEALRELDETRI